jgi:hypothetical protein
MKRDNYVLKRHLYVLKKFTCGSLIIHNHEAAPTTAKMNTTNKGKAKRIILAYQSDVSLRVRDDLTWEIGLKRAII